MIINVRYALLIALLALIQNACNEQDPAFVEDANTSKITLSDGQSLDVEVNESDADGPSDDEQSVSVSTEESGDSAVGDASAAGESSVETTGGGDEASNEASGSDSDKSTGSSDKNKAEDEEDDEDSDDKAKSADMSEDDSSDDQAAGKCAKNFGLSSNRVKVAGKNQDLKLEPTDVLALKVTGRNNKVEINIKGSEGIPEIQGICIFIAGREASVSVNLENIVLGKLAHVTRGNRSNLSVEVGDKAKINSIEGDIRGNRSTTSISGSGTYTCPDKDIRGKEHNYSCK